MTFLSVPEEYIGSSELEVKRGKKLTSTHKSNQWLHSRIFTAERKKRIVLGWQSLPY